MSELWLPLLLFAVAGSLTPGPNNIMLAASGVNYGFRRTVPHMIGICIGFPLMFLAVGLGLSRVFEEAPVIHTALKVMGSAYLLWLAWRVATAEPISTAPVPSHTSSPHLSDDTEPHRHTIAPPPPCAHAPARHIPTRPPHIRDTQKNKLVDAPT